MISKFRKTVSLAIVSLLVLSVLVACGSKATNDSKESTAENAQATTAAEEKKEPVKLKFATTAKLQTQEKWQKLWALVGEKLKDKNISIEPIVIPGEDVDFDKKLMINLMAGEEMDLAYFNASTTYKYVRAKVAQPLDDYISQANYDVDKTYGSMLKRYDGKVYMLPSWRDIHITLYNKKIFDDAKVPYPDNATWTWDKYIETAKALTNAEKGIYGSYMLDWDTYFTFPAKQKKVSAYKEDGTSNLDDPAWADSFKLFADLGNVHKVQPDFITFKSKKLSWDGFMTGKYGMWVVGHWALEMCADKKSYPRDWKVGVALMPQVAAGQKVTLGITGGYGVFSTSTHPKEAFEAVKVMAEEESFLGYGKIPARIDLSDEQYAKIIEGMLQPVADDGVKLEEIKAAIMDPALDVVDEKITGAGMSVINGTLIPEYAGLYAAKQRELDVVVKELKEKADAAIKEDNSGK